MPILYVYVDDSAGTLWVPLRVQVYGRRDDPRDGRRRAWLEADVYLGPRSGPIGVLVEPGDCMVVARRLTGERFAEIPVRVDEGDAEVQPVGIDPAFGAPRDWLNDAAATGLLANLEHRRHPTTEPPALATSERWLWVRVWDRHERSWRLADPPAVRMADPGYALLRLEESGNIPRAVQVGGPGSPWQIALLPPSPGSAEIVVAAHEDSRGWSATFGLLLRSPEAEAQLRALAAGAPVKPAELLGTFSYPSPTLDGYLSSILAGLLALRFNLLGEDWLQLPSPDWALGMAAGDRDEEGMEVSCPSDFLVTVAWMHLRRRTADPGAVGSLLLEAERLGPPFIAYALELLRDGLALLAEDTPEGMHAAEFREALGRVRRYTDAAAPGSGYTSFFGHAPDQPSLVPLVGLPAFLSPEAVLSFAPETDNDEGTLEVPEPPTFQMEM